MTSLPTPARALPVRPRRPAHGSGAATTPSGAVPATLDPLTGLPNRISFLRRLAAATATTAPTATGRTVSSPGVAGDVPCCAVLYIDLDNFKLVNESLGHEGGDQLLIAVAERIADSLRGEDMVARLWGDEFAVLLASVESTAGAVRVAERIAERLGASVSLGGYEKFTTVSVGIALGGPTAGRPEEILRDADTAMCRAKAAGKARHAVFDPTMSAQAMERLTLEADLHRAIARGEFRVHYQPIIRLACGSIAEMEALVRWQHPRRGLLSPGAFVPLAEQTGLIRPIGQWVLDEACRQTRRWHLANPHRPPIGVSVNLSTRQFEQPDLVEKIGRTLETSGLDPAYLKLEITEAVAVGDAELAVATLWMLKGLGLKLAIDDFGTGYSSLSYLKRFPVDTLKIDRSFVSGLGLYPEDGAIVGAIISFANALGLTVTAEGIETAEQLALLRTLGADYGQGYFFGKPAPPEAGGLPPAPQRPIRSA